MNPCGQQQRWISYRRLTILNQYVGQQLLTGQQAEAQAAPNDAELAGQVATMFKGETLRGLLLNAYALGTMGTIAGYAAIGAFIAAAVMLILSLLGFAHLGRVSPDAEIGSPSPPAHA